MSVLQRIAYYQNRRDEAPNQQLARELAAARDKNGVREIAKNLWNENAHVSNDCLKVLYEIGYLEPALIAPYVNDFLKLLTQKNNRLVWGSMIALSTIAALQAAAVFKRVGEIMCVIERGSVITRDNGIKTLAIVAAQSETYRKKIFPYLVKQLKACRPKEIPQYAEHIVVAVNTKNRNEFVRALERRLPEMPPSRAARIRRVIKKVNALN